MSRELKRILCIDDDQDILAIVQLCLHKIGGYDVYACSNGDEAMTRMSDIKPDLILLDVMMPGRDGPSIALKLKESPFSCAVPIIFMTARVQKKEIEDYISRGATAVIAKPFDPMTLSEQIANIWNRHHG